MKNRNDKILLRIAQADAYAMAVEYCKRTEHPELFEEVLKFEHYHRHPTHHKLNPGMYTDDTQMSIAISEALIEERMPSGVAYAAKFFEVFKRDQRDGYSRKFQEILEKSTSWQHMCTLIEPVSNKNGAAMRSVPLGVLDSPKSVMRAAEKHAIITHSSFGGVKSAQAVGLMSHFALHTSQNFSDLPDYVSNFLPGLEFLKEPWRGGVGLQHSDPHGRGIGINTVHAVMTLLIEQPSLMDILRQTIEWRGDTDSVAAIAWGIASTRYQNEVIPSFMEDALEATGNLKYGPQFLLDLGKRLMYAYDV